MGYFLFHSSDCIKYLLSSLTDAMCMNMNKDWRNYWDLFYQECKHCRRMKVLQVRRKKGRERGIGFSGHFEISLLCFKHNVWMTTSLIKCLDWLTVNLICLKYCISSRHYIHIGRTTMCVCVCVCVWVPLVTKAKAICLPGSFNYMTVRAQLCYQENIFTVL